MTFSSPSWRSLNPLKGSLNHPKKVTLNHLENIFFRILEMILPLADPRGEFWMIVVRIPKNPWFTVGNCCLLIFYGREGRHLQPSSNPLIVKHFFWQGSKKMFFFLSCFCSGENHRTLFFCEFCMVKTWDGCRSRYMIYMICF